MAGTAAFVGRQAELAELRAALESTIHGAGGGVWLLMGEAGIGKSRLAEEAVRSVAGQATVAWGRCWEAGGAPAYWPWIQVLRALLRTGHQPRWPEERAALLLQVLPELGELYPHRPQPPPLDPEQARFRLLDALSSVLLEQAATKPLLIMLEDLQVSDPSSLLLLDFLSHLVRAEPVAIVGTLRPPSTHREPQRELLSRILQHARTLALARLSQQDVAAYVRQALHEAPPGLVHSVQQSTEGHPLFMVELTRLLVAHGSAAIGPRAPIPTTIRTAIEQRIGTLSQPARSVLELASVVGRDVTCSGLVQAFGLERPSVAQALEQAAEQDLVVCTAPDTYRFSHGLIRETLYREVPEARRAELHLQLGLCLRDRGGEQVRWSEVAHHLVHAGQASRAAAVEALMAWGQHALQQLAFEEAVGAYRRALELAEASNEGQLQVLLALARAQLQSGQLEVGRATCLRAATMARQRRQADVLAQAALSYGSVLVFGQVDAQLVSLLQEALAAQAPHDSPLRARLMARLAAAQQPAAVPDKPIELARQAIAMARRTGDQQALLDALRAGCSAMMDLAPPAQRLGFNHEHVALALQLGDRVEALRGYIRLVFDHFELADLPAAMRAVERIESICDEIGHPYYRWRSTSMRAMRALWHGRFAEAERLIDQAREEGARGGDPNAPPACLYQRARLLHAQGRVPELQPLMPLFRELFGNVPVMQLSAELWMSALLASSDAPQRAASIEPSRLRNILALGDRTVLDALAELVLARHDQELAAAVADRLMPLANEMISGGVLASTWEGPAARALALVERVLGKVQAASEHFELAMHKAEALQGAPMLARAACDYAMLLLEQGESSRAGPLLDQAEQVAGELGMAQLLVTIRQARAPLAQRSRAPSALPPRVRVAMQPEGEYWRIDCDDQSIRLRDSKGLRLLARLVAQPEREFHALELDAGHDTQGMEAGDAGELLDEKAMQQYRHRLKELQQKLEQAEQWNDVGRAEAARDETQFLQAELSRAVGLGGRQRRAGAAAERARINVQRRLKDAIRRIELQHQPLGRHLARSVRTGTFCCYSPE